MKRALLALCLLTAAARATRADVGVVVTGEATMLPALSAQLEGWLTARGHTVQPASLAPDAINTLIDCFTIGDLGCARTVVDHRAKTETILFAKIEVKADPDGSQDIDISGYWLSKGHETKQERRSCQHCTPDTMHTAADDLLLALTASPPTVIEPPKPASGPGPIADVPAEHRRRAVPIALTAVGGVALVAGIAMIAEGGPPSSTTQKTYTDLRTPGYVVGAAGVVAAGVGLYLLLRPQAHSAPVAAITHDGAVIGWTGRF